MDRPDIVDHSPRELVRRAGNLSAAQATKLAHRSPVQMRRAFTKYGPPTSVQRAPTATKRFKQRSSAIPNSLFASLEWSGLSLKALPDVPRPPLELIVVTTHQGAKVIPEEPVLVRAFLSEEAPQNVAVRFHYSAGRMKPDPLPIPKGSSEGRADLSLDSPGTITLKLVDTQPNNIRLNSDRQWDLTFHPVIAELALIANPTAIPLGESAQVRVELRDPKSKTVVTDETKMVVFTVSGGLATVTPDAVPVNTGTYSSNVVFRPRQVGQFQLEALTNGATTSRPLVVTASINWTAFLATVLGGLLGGGLAAWHHGGKRAAKLFQIVSGPFVAYLLVWAVGSNLVSKVQPSLVENPLGVFVISLLAGWMGTEVFGFLLRGLNLVTNSLSRTP